jgi:hypothetical protein
MKALRILLWAMIINGIGFYLYLIFKGNYTPNPTANKVETCMVYPSNELTKENVYAEIMRVDIKFSEIVLRQVLLETGHFTSHNCLKRNNLLGMKGGVKDSSNVYGYKIYDHWRHSIQAYKIWQSERITEDCADYYDFLSQWKYAESPEYENKLKSIDIKIKI